VLVMADENSRNQTSATLSAFHGTVTRVRLQCGGSASDFAALMNPQNQEAQTRRLLKHCGLPWEDQPGALR
jgi:hypothetical protein